MDLQLLLVQVKQELTSLVLVWFLFSLPPLPTPLPYYS